MHVYLKAMAAYVQEAEYETTARKEEETLSQAELFCFCLLGRTLWDK